GDQRIDGRGMAPAARGSVISARLFALWRPMRVVARLTGHRLFAFEEAAGFSEAVSRAADDLELVGLGRSGRVIECQQKVGQRFAGGEGEWSAIESANECGNRGAGRLQMTLHADVHAEFRTQPRRVHDGGADLLGIGPRRLRRRNVSGARTVAALAI